MIDYTDRSVLVTGAASGIGRALALALAQRGARVICADRDSAGLQETVASLNGGGYAVPCDLAEVDATTELLRRCYEISDHLDLVCSNAGIGHRGGVIDQDMAASELQRLWEINFYASLKLAQGYAARLQESGTSGRFMVTASENSLSVPEAVKRGQMAFYAATKHALLVAMEWLRIDQESGPLDLHVLLPGAVYTPLVAKALPDPAAAPPELELISAEECASRALAGLDAKLFYIPTQAHLLEDMEPRHAQIREALSVLGIEKTY